MFAVAILLRAFFCFGDPFLSDDVFRYIWEGVLSAEGGNPYADAPDAFSPVNDSIHSRINHSEITSIYPPLAMWLFGLLSQIEAARWPFQVFFWTL